MTFVPRHQDSERTGARTTVGLYVICVPSSYFSTFMNFFFVAVNRYYFYNQKKEKVDLPVHVSNRHPPKRGDAKRAVAHSSPRSL